MQLRMRVLKCYVWSALLYGCESWNISSVMRKILEAAEIWFVRRMLRVEMGRSIGIGIGISVEICGIGIGIGIFQPIPNRYFYYLFLINILVFIGTLPF